MPSTPHGDEGAEAMNRDGYTHIPAPESKP